MSNFHSKRHLGKVVMGTPMTIDDPSAMSPPPPWTPGPFETGAHSAEVNDLILYTDNTQALAQERDAIYQGTAEGQRAVNFLRFLRLSVLPSYRREFGANSTHLTHEQEMDFCRLYAAGYADWLAEHEEATP